MPDAASLSSRLKFSNDLRRIREARGLTLEALHEDTKIPLSVLQEFEETGLFDNPMFNRVYLRSLVRTYATFVGIPSLGALEALDEALLDNYVGRLAEEFLGEKPPVVEKPAEAVAAVESVETEETVEAEAVEEAVEAPPPVAEKVPLPVAEKPPPVAEKAPPPKPAAEAPRKEETPKQEDTRKAVPPLLSTATPLERRAPGARRPRPFELKERRTSTQWVLIVGAVLALVAGIVWVVQAVLDGTGTGAPDPQAVAAVDTTAADTTAVPPRPAVILGDTLTFTVVAAQKVERLLVTRDDDARRPYWMEQGTANAYPALDRIVLENKVDRIELLVEGYAYPTGGVDERGRLEVTREMVRAFVDTLTADPVALPSPPKRIPMARSRSS